MANHVRAHSRSHALSNNTAHIAQLEYKYLNVTVAATVWLNRLMLKESCLGSQKDT